VFYETNGRVFYETNGRVFCKRGTEATSRCNYRDHALVSWFDDYFGQKQDDLYMINHTEDGFDDLCMDYCHNLECDFSVDDCFDSKENGQSWCGHTTDDREGVECVDSEKTKQPWCNSIDGFWMDDCNPAEEGFDGFWIDDCNPAEDGFDSKEIGQSCNFTSGGLRADDCQSPESAASEEDFGFYLGDTIVQASCNKKCSENASDHLSEASCAEASRNKHCSEDAFVHHLFYGGRTHASNDGNAIENNFLPVSPTSKRKRGPEPVNFIVQRYSPVPMTHKRVKTMNNAEDFSSNNTGILRPARQWDFDVAKEVAKEVSSNNAERIPRPARQWAFGVDCVSDVCEMTEEPEFGECSQGVHVLPASATQATNSSSLEPVGIRFPRRGYFGPLLDASQKKQHAAWKEKKKEIKAKRIAADKRLEPRSTKGWRLHSSAKRQFAKKRERKNGKFLTKEETARRKEQATLDQDQAG
jgi:hypothetical protein